MGIRQFHASIKRVTDEDDVESYLIAPEDIVGDETNCYLNGDQIIKEETLYHLDRLSFGTNNMFLVMLPDNPPR
jgi:hypothetical protein